MTLREILCVDRTIELVVVALTAMGTKVRVVALKEVLELNEMYELVLVFETETVHSVDVGLTEG